MAYLGNTGLTRSIELINKKFVTAEDLGLPIINTNRTIEFIKTTNTAAYFIYSVYSFVLMFLSPFLLKTIKVIYL